MEENIRKLGFRLVDEYTNSKVKTSITDIEGYFYKPSLLSLLNGHIPDKFHKNNPYTIQNIKLWAKINNKPLKLISEIYEGANKNLKWQCLKEGCREEFEASWGI